MSKLLKNPHTFKLRFTTSCNFAVQNELCGLHKVSPVYATDSPISDTENTSMDIFSFPEDLPYVQITQVQALDLK